MSALSMTYEEKQKASTLEEKVRRLMWDGCWRTLGRIAEQCDSTKGDCLAELTSINAVEFGLSHVARRIVGRRGGFEYCLISVRP